MNDQVEALRKPRIYQHLKKSLNYSCFDVKWIPQSSRFVSVGNFARGTGNLSIWSLKPDEKHKGVNLKLERETEHPSGMKCSSFDSTDDSQRHLAVGDFNGGLNLFDIEKVSNNLKGSVFSIDKAHDGVVHTLDAAGSKLGPPEIATGGSDGAVKIWDIRQKKKPVVGLIPSKNEKKKFDCWAVAFGNCYNNSQRVLAAGYENGDLKFFDLKMNKIIWETNCKNGICSLQFDRKDIKMNKLLATTLEGFARVYDLKTYNQEEGGYAYVEQKVGDQSSTIWCGKHLPQCREIFMASGGAGNLYLYKYHYPTQRSVGDPPKGVPGTIELLSKETIAQQPICSIDWNKHKEGLAVMASFDQQIRVSIVTKLQNFY